MRRWLTRFAVVSLLAATAFAAKQTLLAPARIGVRAALLERGCVEETIANSRAGTIKARRRAKLSPKIGGVVVALPHPRGDRVRKGDLLLRIDDALLAARLTLSQRERNAVQAQAEQSCFAAERATRELARTDRLASEGIVSPDLLDQGESAARMAAAACRAARAGFERASAAVELAQADLAQSVLRAPFDGVVADVAIELGEWTTPSPPALPVPAVIDVIDTSSLYVSAPMDEVDSTRVRAGQPARVTVDSLPGRSLPGRVVRVAAYVLDRLEQNRTVEIEVELADARLAQTLLPGTSADVEVIVSTREDVLRLPTGALMEGEKVLVVADGTLVERRVTVALKNWDWSEIVRGAAEGERVVVSLDRPEVKAGARVRLEQAAKP